MSLTIEEYKSLREVTTFRMGGHARYFAVVENTETLHELSLFAKEHNTPLLILGGGSNVVVSEQETLQYTVGLMKIRGIEMYRENDEYTWITVGAGEVWDDVVAFSVEQKLSGIEAMSAIPGSTGATPVQNVGAYGQDISQVLESVLVFNTETQTTETMNAEACHFGYRDSIFKRKENKHLIIVSVVLKLSKKEAVIPTYPGVTAFFEKKNIASPTLKDIRNAIIEIRRTKLPDPKQVASVGSFFKNPIVPNERARAVKRMNERAVIFDLGDGTSKIGAGFLIDSLGFKGKSFGNLSLYEHNALVVVNNGKATFEELEALVTLITREVKKQFGVELETEPIFVK